MKHLHTSILLFATALFSMTIQPQAKAGESSKKTIMTFSAPVEVPGVVLPAGTYVFKLSDSESNRDIVQVFNKDENHLYATILAKPDFRTTPMDNTMVTFEKRTTGSPEAIKAWFYPDSTYGKKFVYPKLRAMELARGQQTERSIDAR